MSEFSPELLDKQPHCDGEPVFEQPWQAKAFAMVVELNRKEVFSWKEWAGGLSDNIRDYEASDQMIDGDTYYRLWLKTLEELVRRKFPGK